MNELRNFPVLEKTLYYAHEYMTLNLQENNYNITHMSIIISTMLQCMNYVTRSQTYNRIVQDERRLTRVTLKPTCMRER